MCKPMQGCKLVSRVQSDAVQTYGERDVGPVMGTPPHLLNFWTGNVAGLPIGLAGLVDFGPNGKAYQVSVFSQPYASSLVLMDHVANRTKDVLSKDILGRRVA